MDLIKINGVTYHAIVEYIPNFNKLWRDGSGRSPYTGVWNGQILGTFTPLKVKIHIKTPAELSRLVKDLRKDSVTVTAYDVATQREKTATYYTADNNVNVKQFYDGGDVQQYDPIEIEFIPHRPD